MKTDLYSDTEGKVLKIEGALKTSESVTFQELLEEILSSEDKLIIDTKDLEFMCSGGLRALLAAQSIVDGSVGKKMIIRNANKELMDVLNMTGFINILIVE